MTGSQVRVLFAAPAPCAGSIRFPIDGATRESVSGSYHRVSRQLGTQDEMGPLFEILVDLTARWRVPIDHGALAHLGSHEIVDRACAHECVVSTGQGLE